MVLDLFLIIIVLIALFLASIYDIKTHEVPDWLNFSLISLGLSTRLIYSILTKEFNYFFYALLTLGIMFLIGSILYYTKQWGGGDAKLLMALGTIFATKPYFIQSSNLPFIIPLIINILITGAVFGTLYSIFLITKNWSKFKVEITSLVKEKKIRFIQKLILTLAIIIIAISFLYQDFTTKLILIALLVFIVIYTYFWIIIKAVDNCCMNKKISISRVVEGDWLAEDVIDNKKIIFKRSHPYLTKKDIDKLKQLKINYITVKLGIPFVPSFFLGTIITLLGFNIFNLFI